MNKNKEDIFKMIQGFLRDPPVIIWGSGATIPYGIPSMDDLMSILEKKIKGLKRNANLESELGKLDNKSLNKAKKIIMREILQKDLCCLNETIKKTNYFGAIVKMIETFYEAHPRRIDIITTNYDRILEYALSKEKYNYTDGFTGKALSKFQGSFGNKCIVNLIKVHGSLNWMTYNGDVIFLPCMHKISALEYAMILPNIKKYEEGYNEPYRTLIAESDKAIKAAKSFLVVGFGFNDEHLTPKIEGKIEEGIPIVVITKKATDSCQRKLDSAVKYCLLQESGNDTEIIFRENKTTESKKMNLEGNYWALKNFMEKIL